MDPEKQYRKIKIATNICVFFSSHDFKWFLCFGTLLHLIRKPQYFNLQQDIDIGVIGNINTLVDTLGAYRIDHIVKSNSTGDILNLCYYDDQNSIYIDIFRWVKFKGMYWHTYDQYHQRPQNGILKNYVFRSMPVEVFDISKKDIQKYQEDLRYGNMNKHGTWYKPLPEQPQEGIQFCVPARYGYFLDVAYPEWATERKDFGQSEGFSKIEVDSCKGLC